MNSTAPAHPHTPVLRRHVDAARVVKTYITCAHCGIDMDDMTKGRDASGKLVPVHAHDVAIVDASYRYFTRVGRTRK